MKRTSLLALGLSIGLAAAGLTLAVSPALQDRIFVAGAKQFMTKRAHTEKLFADDALRVVVCGSSGPLADRASAKACVMVIAGGKFYVVDLGPESAENAGYWMFPMQHLGGVFITHLHSDHIGELGEWNLQSWVHGRRGALPVFGPPGIERVVAGFSEAYALDCAYRTAHHGAKFLPPESCKMEAHPVAMPEPDTGRKDRTTLAFQNGDLKVTAIEIDHRVVQPAYGYRFDYRGRSVVISGDTAYHPPLAKAAQGADVLFHEANADHLWALLRQAGQGTPGLERINRINADLNDYHATPVQAAKIANAAGVRELVLYHIMPPVVTRLQLPMWRRGLDRLRPSGVRLAHDGMLIELPLKGDEIRFGDIE